MAKKNKRSSSSNEIESKKTKKKMGGVGRINSLSDSILHHVLSFLTLREAIQTSLVSKRWRYLSASIPTFNFTKGQGTKKAFMEFVETIIMLRHNSYTIQRISISDEKDDSSSSESDSESSKEDDSDTDSNSYDFDPPSKIFILRLNILIRSAIIRNLEEIHLEICFGKSLELPHCLFTCNSLKKLELHSLDQKRSELILPPADSISLPLLQTLHLHRLTLHHHEDDFKTIHFFSTNCCPALESLTLYKCGFHKKNLNINAPKLKHFVINEKYLSKKQFMEHGGVTGSVRLYAPNLISFHSKDYLSKSYCLENLPSLVEAHIDMKVRAQEKLNAKILEYGRHVAMISGEKMINFGILHNVKLLKLSAWALQIFIATYESSSDSASTEFHNLRSLELETWLSGDCMCGITCLLHISPNIVKLSVKIIEDTITPVSPQCDQTKLNPADIGDYLKLPLHCMLDYLKYVEIRGLMGTVNELKFLEVLLKNAVVLEELIVGFSPDYLKDECSRKKRLVKYRKNLQSFPRASSNVSILFIS